MNRIVAYACLLSVTATSAQQDVNLNRITLHGGLTRYVGDIDQQWSQVNMQDMAFGAFGYQRFLGYGTSVYSQLSTLRLQGNDLDAGNFARGLNFRSELHTVELGFRTYLDNGSWLDHEARIAPFFSVGAGFGTYSILVDQHNAQGGRYYYWGDGTVRDVPQTDPNAGLALITGQDGEYETDVTELATEDGKPDDKNFFFIPAQIGLKVRLSQRFSVDLAYGFNWTFTDHLDDISGDYRTSYENPELAHLANPAGATGQRGDANTNDHYHHASIGIAYSFGRRSHHYRMNPVYLDDASSRVRAVVPAPPAPEPPKPVPPPVAKPSVVQVADELRVKRLVISELVVDTIIIRSGRSVPKPIAVDTVERSVVQDSTLRIAKPTMTTPTIVANVDSAASVQMKDTAMTAPKPVAPLRSVKVDGTIVKHDSLAARMIAPVTTAEVDPIKPVKPDTTIKVIVPAPPSVPMTTDPLKKPAVISPSVPLVIADTLKKTTTIVPPPVIAPVRTDTIRGPAAVPPPATVPVGVPPPVVAPAAQPAEVDSAGIGKSIPPVAPPPSGSVTTVIIQQQPAPPVVVPPTVNEPTDRPAQPTVFVPVPVPTATSTTNEGRIKTLQDSLAAMRAEQQRLERLVDGSRTAGTVTPGTAPTGTPAEVDSTDLAAELARSRTYRKHAELLNRMLLDRIALMEMYMALQDEHASDSTLEATREKVLALDKQVEALRDSLRTERAKFEGKPDGRPAIKTTTATPKDSTSTVIGKQASTDTLYFRSGSVYVQEQYRARLKEIASEFVKNGRGNVLVTGHTDRSGKAEFNAMLSQQRADAVAKVLRDAGVPAAAIKVKGLGEKLARSTYNVKERNVVVQMVVEK